MSEVSEEEGNMPKIFRILCGTLGGGFISALCVALFSWIVILTAKTEGSVLAWSNAVVLLAGFMGLVIGLPLGLLISLVKPGPIPGAVLGLLAGLALIAWGSQLDGGPDFVFPRNPLLVGFILASALSGFLISRLVSQIVE